MLHEFLLFFYPYSSDYITGNNDNMAWWHFPCYCPEGNPPIMSGFPSHKTSKLVLSCRYSNLTAVYRNYTTPYLRNQIIASNLGIKTMKIYNAYHISMGSNGVTHKEFFSQVRDKWQVYVYIKEMLEMKAEEIMDKWTRSSLVQVMACCQSNVKPYHNPLLTYCHLKLQKQT